MSESKFKCPMNATYNAVSHLGMFTIPADGFQRLIAYLVYDRFVWIHPDYRK